MKTLNIGIIKNHIFRLYLIFFIFNAFLFSNDNNYEIKYYVDVKNIEDDIFRITVEVNRLDQDSCIYNLAAVVPGTYERHDFGRFVTSFSAFNDDGQKLNVKRLDVNTWLVDPSVNCNNLKISYIVEDTWDSEIDSPLVSTMIGTEIDDNIIIMNTFGVLGYFNKMQSKPIKLKIDYPDNWTVGTALSIDNDGYYIAESFDHLADSPFLIGKLSVDNINVNGMDVEVYVYAIDKELNAENIIKAIDRIINASVDYIGFNPVDRYVFLFRFISQEEANKLGIEGSGALEHSYSSLYTLKDWTGDVINHAESIIAHEFLHILTPLHLSSMRIQNFNFKNPNPSKHLWLYEGVTEWNSGMVQVQSGIINLEEYLNVICDKIITSEYYDENYSLEKMSLESYTKKGNEEFINIYNRGALTACMLDIKLLELSKGEKGLWDVFVNLIKKYGKNNPFEDDEFFNILINNTYPEIKQFIDDYIVGTKPLPFQEYFNKVGINYYSERPTRDPKPFHGFYMNVNEANEFIVFKVFENLKEDGLKEMDKILKINGVKINREVGLDLLQKPIGTPVDYLIIRDGQELLINSKIYPTMDFHIIDLVDSLSSEQQLLAEAWIGKNAIIGPIFMEDYRKNINNIKINPKLIDELGIEMVYIKGGNYMMGDLFGDEPLNRQEKMAYLHEVEVGDFYLSSTEITFNQYDLYCESKGIDKPDDCGFGRGDRPVINVTWQEAQNFCKWLSEKTGENYRLPTEAEWEYAAREQGKKVRFGNGKDVADPSYINFESKGYDERSFIVPGINYAKTVPVMSFPPNALGLYEMTGNVYEWCQDWFDPEYSKSFSAMYMPTGPTYGKYKVIKGNAWQGSIRNCSYRGIYSPDAKDSIIGYRVAKSD